MNPLKKLNLRQQLMLLFLVMVSPIILLNWYGNVKAERIQKRHVTNAYEELNKQNHYLINRDIDTVNRIMTTIIQHPITQQLIPDPNDSVVERVNKYKAMDSLLGSYSLGVGGGEAVFYSFFVYDPDDLYSFVPKKALTNAVDSGVYFFGEGAEPDWFNEAVDKKGKGYLKVINHFSHSHQQKTLALVRAVNNISYGKQVIGVLVATSMEKKIKESLLTVSLPDAELYLTDRDYQIFAATNKEVGETLKFPGDAADKDAGAGPGYDANPTDSANPGAAVLAGASDSATAGGPAKAAAPEEPSDSTSASGYIYVSHEDALTEQKLIYKIPVKSLLRQQSELKVVIWLLSLAYFTLGFILVMYFWRWLMKPMQKLASFAQSYEPGGKVPTVPNRRRTDEVGMLTNTIYEMAGRLNGLIRNKYQMEIKQKEAQLQILYQQINPHLLYNTLESIYWKCSLEGNQGSGEMIKELSKLMRISLSKGRELITLDEEIQHAVAYINLQLMRYEYGFRVEWAIPRELLTAAIPKITLQPLIENAIIHGVRNMGEDGLIRISATVPAASPAIPAVGPDPSAISAFPDAAIPAAVPPASAAAILLIVEDNGYKKVDYAQLNRLLQEDIGGAAASTGYGVRNIHQRLQLHFGKAYGLSFHPRPEGGTAVSLLIPLPELPIQTDSK